MTDAREQYLAAWRVFAELAHSVPAGQWDAPTPCAEWTVRALIGHVLDGAHQVQAMAGGQDPVPPIQQPQDLTQLTGPDPAAAVHRAVADLEVALGGLPADTVVHTRAGELPLQQMLGMALIEPVAHGWDLATATGQQATFDAEAVTALLAGVQQLGGQLAATGMYRPATIVDEQAPPLKRLMAALGRTTG